LKLTAFNISAKLSDAAAFRNMQPKLSSELGGRILSNSIGHIGPNGSTFAVEGRLIRLMHLAHM
jgi:hypothetical protein